MTRAGQTHGPSSAFPSVNPELGAASSCEAQQGTRRGWVEPSLLHLPFLGLLRAPRVSGKKAVSAGHQLGRRGPGARGGLCAALGAHAPSCRCTSETPRHLRERTPQMLKTNQISSPITWS